MNSELNLELYTIAMTRLNNGFAKIGDIIQDNTDLINSSTDAEDFNKLAIKIKRTLPDFRKSSSEFEEFYNDIVDDLSQDEINVNEYQPFFEHVDEVFPAYESQLNDGIAGLKGPAVFLHLDHVLLAHRHAAAARYHAVLSALEFL